MRKRLLVFLICVIIAVFFISLASASFTDTWNKADKFFSKEKTERLMAPFPFNFLETTESPYQTICSQVNVARPWEPPIYTTQCETVLTCEAACENKLASLEPDFDTDFRFNGENYWKCADVSPNQGKPWPWFWQRAPYWGSEPAEGDRYCQLSNEENSKCYCSICINDTDGDGYAPERGNFASEISACPELRNWITNKDDCVDNPIGKSFHPIPWNVNPDICLKKNLLGQVIGIREDIDCSKVEFSTCAKCINPDAEEVCWDNIPNKCECSDNYELVTYSTGKQGQAADFDGADSTGRYVAVADKPSLNTDKISVSAWIKADNLGTVKIILSKRASGDLSGFILDLYNGKPSFVIGNGTANIRVTSSQTIIADNWYFITGTYDGANAKIFVDGNEKGSILVNSLALNDRRVVIGAYDGDYPEYRFDGLIDEAKVWNRALSVDEIVAEYKQATLIAYYKFENNANDETRNNNGVNNGATFVSGKQGKATSFDGVDDYVDLGNSNSLNPTAEFTLSAWVNPKDLAGAGRTQGIISRWYSAPQGANYILRLYGNKFQFVWNKAGATQYLTATDFVPVADNWHHVAATFKSGEQKIYVDGVLINSASVTGTSTSSTGNSVIGRQTTSNYFKGLIDELKIWNRALNEDEIKQEYGGASLVAYYKFEGNANDETGVNNGIWHGTATYSQKIESCQKKSDCFCPPPDKYNSSSLMNPFLGVNNCDKFPYKEDCLKIKNEVSCHTCNLKTNTIQTKSLQYDVRKDDGTSAKNLEKKDMLPLLQDKDYLAGDNIIDCLYFDKGSKAYDSNNFGAATGWGVCKNGVCSLPDCRCDCNWGYEVGYRSWNEKLKPRESPGLTVPLKGTCPLQSVNGQVYYTGGTCVPTFDKTLRGYISYPYGQLTKEGRAHCQITTSTIKGAYCGYWCALGDEKCSPALKTFGSTEMHVVDFGKFCEAKANETGWKDYYYYIWIGDIFNYAWCYCGEAK